MVHPITFHLQSTKNPLINDYSDRFSKGTVSYLNIQISRFLESISKSMQRSDSLKFNGIQFYEWQILNYFQNWCLILFVKDNFIYKNFSKGKNSNFSYNWSKLNFYSFLRHYFFQTCNLSFLKETFKGREKDLVDFKFNMIELSKYTTLSLNRILIYLNFIFFRLPLILHIKKSFYNFIFFNFFKDEFYNTRKSHIIFCITTENYPSSSIVSQFIGKKLIQRFSVSIVLRKVLYYMAAYFKRDMIGGFRILVKGRVTRKERMTFKWQKRGKLSLNSKFAAIDFVNRLLIMRYGSCSVQVWIHR